MVEHWLPYSRTEVPMRIPDENLLGVVDAKYTPPAPNPQEEIAKALDNPLGTQRVEDLVKPGEKVCIVVDDQTRPTPSHHMVRPLLERLNRAGVKDSDIIVIVGCGTHLNTRPEEVAALIGEDCSKRVGLVIHDSEAPDLVQIGNTSFGTKVRVNKIFAEAEIKILTGDVELHYFSGYGGGRKSVLPAITDTEATRHNHAFLLDPKAKTGNLEGNPVHLDMTEAAYLSKVNFTINLVLNPKGQVVKAYAGDLDQAFLEGVKLVDKMYKVSVESAADIVVVSPGGYPTDIDLYQAYKGLDAALNVVKDGGVVVLIAECIEGYGHKVFYDWMLRFKTLDEMQKEVKRRFELGGHKAYYLMRALERVKIILVSTLPDYYATGVFRLRTAKTANIALNMAFRLLSRRGKVLVLPHGATTLPILQK